jgi:hypothetical protein
MITSSMEQNGNRLRKEGKEIWKEEKTKKNSFKKKKSKKVTIDRNKKWRILKIQIKLK